MQLPMITQSSFTRLTLLALSGFALMASPARASVTITQGDLIFGVRDTSTTTPNSAVYLFDLGHPPASGTTIATSLATDLNNLFGSDWYTNTSLQWSISGYSGANTLVASKVEPAYGTQSTKYSGTTFSPGNRNIVVGDIQNIDVEYGNGSLAAYSGVGFTTGGTSASGGVAVSNTDINGYAFYMPGYSFFGGNFEALGFSGQAVDMYTINGTLASNVVYGGSFNVDSSGNVNFTATPPTTTVPEPGRAMLLGLGMAGLLFRRRRA